VSHSFAVLGSMIWNVLLLTVRDLSQSFVAFHNNWLKSLFGRAYRNSQ